MKVHSWDEFKTFVDNKSLNIQWIEVEGHYYLTVIEGPFQVTHIISKNGSSDQTDFETNYKAKGNKPIKQRSYNNLGEDDRFSFEGTGMLFTPTAQVTSEHDLLFDKSYAIKGGFLYSDNVLVGDYIKIEIVDKDNVLGGGAGYIVDEYIKKWYVMPGHQIGINNEFVGVLPVPGLYLRVTYTSTGASPQVMLNLYTYEVIE